MSKALLSLNFMYCMERFATQTYRSQLGAFTDRPISEKLTAASQNERGHVQKLQGLIKKLNGHVYPLGWLFQFLGVVVGWITRLSGHRNLFKADTFVETRAVKDYNGFLKAVPFDANTVEVIRGIIKDEIEHIRNWKQAGESLIVKKTLPSKQ
jgi:rubrerythrin